MGDGGGVGWLGEWVGGWDGGWGMGMVEEWRW